MGGGTGAAFEEALTRALTGSGYVRAVREPDLATLNLTAGVSSVSGGGSVCLPFVGCVSGTTVRAHLELTDRRTGEVRWNDSCEGTSGGFSTWGWWAGSIYLDTDDGKAAADCAGKLVQKLTGSPVLKPYLTLAPGAALTGTPATPAPAPAATPILPAPSAAVSPQQAEQSVKMLEAHLRALAFADANGLFTSDPYNPVKLKELNAAATAQTLALAAQVRLTVTPGENVGPYQLIGVSYTLPGGPEKFVQLAVSADPTVNARGGRRLVYLSAFNPLRSSVPALDGLSKNVETLLDDVHRALKLPPPR